MPGTEVCKRLASDPDTANIPVVLISAKGAEIRQAYEDVGNVVSYITKPFTPDVVTGVVADVLERSREGGLVKMAVPGVEVLQPVRAAAPPPEVEAEEAWEEEEVSVAEAYEREVAERPSIQRDVLEMMFETLRAGLEGVYVEEVDTRAGALVDYAKSYTDLASQLTRQLGETLAQARSGLSFSLGSDGSLRSLDESLLDAYRRLCRLLFRAVTAGALQKEGLAGRPRVLVACHCDSAMFESMQAVTRDIDECHTLFVAERFRQLPMLVRLYGPTHLIVDVGHGGALLDQLKVIREMPEGKRLQIVAVTASRDRQLGLGGGTPLSELGIGAVIQDGPGLLLRLRERVHPAASSGASWSGESASVSMQEAP
jgi:hypothetical protein